MKLRNFLVASVLLLGASNVLAQTTVTPAAGTANPYAYALSSTNEAGLITVNYSLNADAVGVTLVVRNQEGTAVITQELDGVAKGAHSTTFDLAGQETSCYTWEIQVAGEEKSAVQEFTKIGFNHSRGVDTDRNFDSPNFGNIYVTEGRKTTSSAHYSYTNGGQGLYIFTPDMQGVKNDNTGKYAFTGGLTLDQYVLAPSGSNTSGADFCRVRIDETGKIYLTRQNDNGDYLYAADAAALIENNTLNAIFTGGSVDTGTYAYENADGSFVSAPNIGFDIKGSGESFKMVMLSGQKRIFPSTYSYTASRVDEYALGTATTWSSTPTAVAALSGKYTVSASGTNVTYDNRGGIWYCQYQSAPVAEKPALVYVDANGNELYKDATTVRGGGAIRFTPDFSKVAISSSSSTFSIYGIEYAEDGTPTLTEELRITHGMGTNVNDIAWDLAGNIYAVNNNGECLKGFSVPRENNTFTTKAAAQYSICYTAPVAPLYVAGINGNWSPDTPAEIEFNGTAYVLNVDENTTEFKISTTKGTWPEFNEGNLTVDAAITNGGTVNLLVNKDAGNIVLPWAGVWTVTIAKDFSTLTAVTETPEPTPVYPEAVYMVGYNGAWEPASPLEIVGENGIYKAEAVEFTGTIFKLSTAKGTWDDFNNSGLNVESNPVAIGQEVTLTTGYSQDINIALAGTYDITIDLANNTLLLEGTVSYPDCIYAIGNVNGYNWSTADGVVLEHTADGVYKGVVDVNDSGNGNGYFQFATVLGDGWETVNSGTRYGAQTQDEAIVLNTPTPMTDDWAGGTQSWMIAAGKYSMYVDIVNCTVRVEEGDTVGIESVEAEENATPVYYNLQGVEVKNPANGLYIVKRGNKISKETIVK